MILKKKQIIQFSLIAIALSFAACSNSKNGEEKTAAIDIIDFSKMPSMEGDSIHTLVTYSGKLTYRMIAPKLSIFDKVDEPYWNFPQGINMVTYDEEGKIESDIKSNLAIYHIKEELWELRKNVVALNPEGKKLETEILYWNQKTEKIYSDTLVTVTEDGMRTTGTGFTADQNFDVWDMDDFTTEFIMED